MIKVKLAKSKISVEGHALFDEINKDIVCAAVSAVVIGGINFFQKDDLDVDVNEKKAVIKLALKNLVCDNVAAFNVIIVQLRTIAKSYPKYLKISKGE